MAVQNPNWPVLDYAVSWNSGPLQAQAALWSSLTSRTEGRVSSKRGKQYELDQVQPGQATVTLRNNDGALDPTNAASPFWPMVAPYRQFRIRAQWPPVANLFTGDQATASFQSSGAVTTPTLPMWVSNVGLGVTVAPLNGTTNQYVAASVSPGDLFTVSGFSVVAGATYTAQCQFTAPSGSSGAQVGFRWYDQNGVSINPAGTYGAAVSGVSGNPTCTLTAPANAAGAQVIYAAAAGAVNPLRLFALQLEQAAAATSYVTPVWYPIFAGLVERWPQSWSSGGNYGLSNLTIVDLFAWWASRGLSYAAYLELLALPMSPSWSFFYPLDEQAGATVFRDLLNNRAAATLYTPTSAPFQTIQPGNSLQSTGGYLPLGSAPQVTSVVPQPGMVSAQMIDLTAGGLNLGLGTGAGNPWTRVLAFRTPKTPSLASTSAVLAWSQSANNASTYVSVSGNYDGAGNFGSLSVLGYVNGTNVQAAQTSPVGLSLSDGGWHLLVYSSDGGTNFKCYLDGVLMTCTATGSVQPTGVGATDVLGGQLLSTVKVSSNGPACDLAFFGQLFGQLNATQVQNLYEAFRYGWGSQSPTHDETSDQRYARLLAWAGFIGTERLSAGSTVLYGPAVDLQGGASPTSLLTALQAVVETENGQHFIGSDGAAVFQSRADRYNKASLLTFGELVGSGEVPYLGAATDFDPTRVANDITTTAEFAGTTGAPATSFRVVDSTSGAQYGDITMGRTINTLDAGELLGAAQYLLSQNAQPQQRLEQIVVDVASNPTLWPLLLARELSDPVTVKRRPSNAPAITVPGFLEQIQWDFDDKGRATFSAQVSNSALHAFGQFDSATYGLFDSTLIFGY